jgi:hypothetical protein
VLKEEVALKKVRVQFSTISSIVVIVQNSSTCVLTEEVALKKVRVQFSTISSIVVIVQNSSTRVFGEEVCSCFVVVHMQFFNLTFGIWQDAAAKHCGDDW